MSVERAIPGGPEGVELSAPHLARYLFAADYARGCRVLDAGTGSGYGAAILKQQGGARSVQAVDRDAKTINRSRLAYAIEGLEFLVDDCEKLGQLVGPFYVICSFENLEHLEYPERFLARAARL